MQQEIIVGKKINSLESSQRRVLSGSLQLYQIKDENPLERYALFCPVFALRSQHRNLMQTHL